MKLNQARFIVTVIVGEKKKKKKHMADHVVSRIVHESICERVTRGLVKWSIDSP